MLSQNLFWKFLPSLPLLRLILLVGFGTFEVAERAERTGRNPQTGKDIVIPASKSPKFKAGKALKDIVNA